MVSAPKLFELSVLGCLFHICILSLGVISGVFFLSLSLALHHFFLLVTCLFFSILFDPLFVCLYILLPLVLFCGQLVLFFCFLSSIASLQNTMFQIVLSACVAVAMGYPRPQAQGPIATSRDGGLQIPGAAG